jgi:hypothetical protein
MIENISQSTVQENEKLEYLSDPGELYASSIPERFSQAKQVNGYRSD